MVKRASTVNTRGGGVCSHYTQAEGLERIEVEQTFIGECGLWYGGPGKWSTCSGLEGMFGGLKKAIIDRARVRK